MGFRNTLPQRYLRLLSSFPADYSATWNRVRRRKTHHSFGTRALRSALAGNLFDRITRSLERSGCLNQPIPLFLPLPRLIVRYFLFPSTLFLPSFNARIGILLEYIDICRSSAKVVVDIFSAEAFRTPLIISSPHSASKAFTAEHSSIRIIAPQFAILSREHSTRGVESLTFTTIFVEREEAQSLMHSH